MNFKSKIILAPLAGITDTVLRGICREYGADIVLSEMVSAEGLTRASGATEQLLRFCPAERPIGIQLFGADPARMGQAVEQVCRLCEPDFIDLNSGCPVRKVVRRNGGAALMRNPDLFGRIVEAMVRHSSVPVTVKIRSGWQSGQWVDVELARIAEQCGAAAVTLHPRSVEVLYSGHSFWERIALVKQSVGIPLIGNGDITLPRHARDMLTQTGCDSIMIGRGALGNPWLLGQCRAVMDGREPQGVSAAQRLELALRHLRLFRERFGEHRAASRMKSQLAWYTRALSGGARLRKALFAAAGSHELEELLREALNAATPVSDTISRSALPDRS